LGRHLSLSSDVRSVQRAISRAKAIPGDIRAIIKGTKLDTGVYLDTIKGMESVNAPPYSAASAPRRYPPENPRRDSASHECRKGA